MLSREAGDRSSRRALDGSSVYYVATDVNEGTPVGDGNPMKRGRAARSARAGLVLLAALGACGGKVVYVADEQDGGAPYVGSGGSAGGPRLRAAARPAHLEPRRASRCSGRRSACRNAAKAAPRT